MATNESPEQLIDVFKTAALSVTKLYKTSAAAQARARSDGYQDCLDDLLAFLDKEDIGLNDGEGWRIRQWATERYEGGEPCERSEGRDSGSQTHESEDEVEKPEPVSSPEISRTTISSQQTSSKNEIAALPAVSPMAEEPTPIAVPTQDVFTFQSSHAYPNIGNLDLSDSRAQEIATQSNPMLPPAPSASTRSIKNRHSSRNPARSSGTLGRGAGQKRKHPNLSMEEIFGMGSFGGKDVFSNPGKRGRHS